MLDRTISCEQYPLFTVGAHCRWRENNPAYQPKRGKRDAER